MLTDECPSLTAASSTLLCRSSASGGDANLIDASSGTCTVLALDDGDDLPDPIPEVDDQPVQMPSPVVDEDGNIPIEHTEWFKQNDSVMTRNHRDRKLTRMQRHIKSGHLGWVPNCPICMQTAATRRVSENAVEKVDQQPGRTWSIDSIYQDRESYQGSAFTIVMYNGATGYMHLAFMGVRSTAGDKIKHAVLKLRQDPRFKWISQVVEILMADPAPEWHARNVNWKQLSRCDSIIVIPVPLLGRY